MKGLDHASTGLHLVSNMIKEALGISDISVLMGANLAKEVAREMFGEATIGMIANKDHWYDRQAFVCRSCVSDILTVAQQVRQSRRHESIMASEQSGFRTLLSQSLSIPGISTLQ